MIIYGHIPTHSRYWPIPISAYLWQNGNELFSHQTKSGIFRGKLWIHAQKIGDINWQNWHDMTCQKARLPGASKKKYCFFWAQCGYKLPQIATMDASVFPSRKTEENHLAGSVISTFLLVFFMFSHEFQELRSVSANNVLLVKIEGPVWYTIYHHLPVVKGVNKPLY